AGDAPAHLRAVRWPADPRREGPLLPGGERAGPAARYPRRLPADHHGGEPRLHGVHVRQWSDLRHQPGARARTGDRLPAPPIARPPAALADAAAHPRAAPARDPPSLRAALDPP